MAKRKSISKRVRFEVFKRDGFICQYCGAHPPAVTLHIDHIRPIALDGTNDIDNLVTACDACNLGKGARDLKSVPESLASKAKLIAEREEQLRGYYEVIEAKRQRIEDEIWTVADEIESGASEKGMRRDWLASIRMFIEKLGFYSVLECAEIARGRYPYGGRRTFLYFCGCCWKRVRGEDGQN